MSDDDRAARAELLRLTQSGDLLDLAREMRTMGVESLLFCSSSGRIRQVVTDRQIAHLAALEPAPVKPSGSGVEAPAVRPAAADQTGLPHQPVRADTDSPARRR